MWSCSTVRNCQCHHSSAIWRTTCRLEPYSADPTWRDINIKFAFVSKITKEKKERYFHFTDLRLNLNVVCFCFRFGRISLNHPTRCVRPPWARHPSPWTVSGAGTRSGPAPDSSATSRTTCRRRASAVPIQGMPFLQPMIQTILLLIHKSQLMYCVKGMRYLWIGNSPESQFGEFKGKFRGRMYHQHWTRLCRYVILKVYSHYAMRLGNEKKSSSPDLFGIQEKYFAFVEYLWA